MLLCIHIYTIIIILSYKASTPERKPLHASLFKNVQKSSICFHSHTSPSLLRTFLWSPNIFWSTFHRSFCPFSICFSAQVVCLSQFFQLDASYWSVIFVWSLIHFILLLSIPVMVNFSGKLHYLFTIFLKFIFDYLEKIFPFLDAMNW